LAKKEKIATMDFSNTTKKKTTTLEALEKTMKKKTKLVGVLKKNRIVRRRPNPCFFTILVSYPKSCKHEGRKLKICVHLHNTRGGKLKLFKSHKKLRKR